MSETGNLILKIGLALSDEQEEIIKAMLTVVDRANIETHKLIGDMTYDDLSTKVAYSRYAFLLCNPGMSMEEAIAKEKELGVCDIDIASMSEDEIVDAFRGFCNHEDDTAETSDSTTGVEVDKASTAEIMDETIENAQAPIKHGIEELLEDEQSTNRSPFDSIEELTNGAGEAVVQEEAGSKEEKFAEGYYDSTIEQYTNSMMIIYEQLYADAYFRQKPFGILVDGGVIRYKNNEFDYYTDYQFASLYTFLKSWATRSAGTAFNGSISDKDTSTWDRQKMLYPTFKESRTYYPQFQMLIAMKQLKADNSVNTWEKASNMIRKAMYKNIASYIQYLIESEEGEENIEAILNDKLTQFMTAFTNSIVIYSGNTKEAVSVRMCLGGNGGIAKELREELESGRSGLFANNFKVGRCSPHTDGGCVIDLDIIIDEVTYYNKPLLAYIEVEKLLESQGKASISNIILGQRPNMEYKTVDYSKSETATAITQIVAGQRAGKGVMTLSLLGPLIGAGCPIVYLDDKPEMAKTLYDIASSRGLRIAAWDAGTSLNSTANRQDEEAEALGMPILAEYSNLFGYLKTIQLMVALATYEMDGSKPHSFIDEVNPAVLIIDEAEAAGRKMQALRDSLSTLARDKKLKDNVNKIIAWLDNLCNETQAAVNSQIPMSGVKIIELYQTSDASAWVGESPMKCIAKSATCTKILGRGTIGGSEYGILSKNVDNDASKMISERRYWALRGTPKGQSKMSTNELFKPFLTLNDYKSGAPSVEQFKTNLKNAGLTNYLSSIEEEGTGDLDPRAGFEGFTEMYGDGINHIDGGINLLEAMFQQAGLDKEFASLDAYLHSVALNSLLTVGVIKRRLLGIVDTKSEDVKEEGFKLSGGEDNLGADALGYDTGSSTVDERAARKNSAGSRVRLNGFEGPSVQMDIPIMTSSVEQDIRNAHKEQIYNRMNGGEEFSLDDNEYTNDGEPLDDFNESVDGVSIDEDLEPVDDEDKEIDIIGQPKQRKDFQSERADMRSNNRRRTMEWADDGQTIRRMNLAGMKVTERRLESDNAIVVYVRQSDYRQKLFKNISTSSRGAEYACAQMFKIILNEVRAQFGNLNMIKSVQIEENDIFFNKKQIVLCGVLVAAEIIDVLDIKLLYKSCPMLREIYVDQAIFDELCLDNDNPIEHAFNKLKRLNKFGVYPSANNRHAEVVTRDIIKSKRVQDKLRKMEAKSRTKNQLDAACAAKNYNSASLDSMYSMRAMRKCAAYTGKMYSTVVDNVSKNNAKFFSSSVLMPLTFGLVGIVGTIGGAVIGGALDLGSLIKNKVSK